jgi:hypothetical protein
LSTAAGRGNYNYGQLFGQPPLIPFHLFAFLAFSHPKHNPRNPLAAILPIPFWCNYMWMGGGGNDAKRKHSKAKAKNAIGGQI